MGATIAKLPRGDGFVGRDRRSAVTSVRSGSREAGSCGNCGWFWSASRATGVPLRAELGAGARVVTPVGLFVKQCSGAPFSRGWISREQRGGEGGVCGVEVP